MGDQLKKMLEQHEGKRSKPYRDSVGKLTIGIGRNLDDVGVSEDEIYMMLDNDVKTAKIELFKALPWAFKLDEPRQAVLLSMTFNMGIGGLLEFKKTLSAVEAGEYAQASKYMLDSKWATQVGNRAIYLAKVMETGQY